MNFYNLYKLSNLYNFSHLYNLYNLYNFSHFSHFSHFSSISHSQSESWISHLVQNLPRKDSEKKVLFRFLVDVFSYLEKNMTNMSKKGDKTKSEQYKDGVIQILCRDKPNQFPIKLKEEELKSLQMEIENLTMSFDDKSMFKTAPNIIRILIKENLPNAKDFLRGFKLDNNDMELLSEFGQYTIEALIVHELGQVFHSVETSSIIRVATLVERLESSVRIHASLLKSRRCIKEKSRVMYNEVMKSGKEKKRSKLYKKYPFGSGLVQFMEERKLITLITGLNGSARVLNKQGHFYLPTHLYAVCNFDISLLPIKLNLPMICKPLDWISNCPPDQKPRYLSDLSGGYLSSPTKEMYVRYRLLSSADINNFYIDLGDNYQILCRVMNKLQSQAFQINHDWLKYIQDNENLLIENGYLMPKFLIHLNILDVSRILREYHMKDKVINKLYSFNELLNMICKLIQRACYEDLILKLAIAYDGYHFYLPAFLDFRGRIYRSGVLHFHERDLARSLIIFADVKKNEMNLKKLIYTATAFHYKSFVSVNEADQWLVDNISLFMDNPLSLAQEAKHPWQFLSNVITCKSENLAKIPITQDASASAYQIMSYFLLDYTLARRTNLISSSDEKIKDIYSFFLEELKEFMKNELDNNLSKVVCDNLTRQIVKGIFMPIIYGKTLQSTASDLKEHLSHYITYKECFNVASVCFKFWRTKYQNMDCLIQLIRDIGWIASASDSPVYYGIPYFTTVQDYMIMEPINIWIYDSLHKKRRRVTLRVSSSKKDRKKTGIATFVNFIHQRDACIAMSVVEDMLYLDAPIYTVHDNFITTAQYSDNLTTFYCHAICKMGPPLSIINEFIYMNVIKPIQKRMSSYGLKDGIPDSMVISKEEITCMVINKDLLKYYLNANIPKNITKKMMATWEERNSRILTSYEKYTNIVIGDYQFRNSWEAHERMWNDFKLIIEKSVVNTPQSYCVHY